MTKQADEQNPGRPLLARSRVALPAARQMAAFHADVVQEVERAVAEHPVVVVGMAQNPHVKNVRKALQRAGVALEYLEYGSYFSGWRKRLAIKLWSANGTNRLSVVTQGGGSGWRSSCGAAGRPSPRCSCAGSCSEARI